VVAKALGVQLYKSVGGAVRDRVRMTNTWAAAPPGGLRQATVDAFRRARRRSVAPGFKGAEILAVPVSRAARAGGSPLRHAEQLMGAVRDAVGRTEDVMVDLHGNTDAGGMRYSYCYRGRRTGPGSWMSRARRRMSTRWYEASAYPIPIATAKRIVTRPVPRDLLEKRPAR